MTLTYRDFLQYQGVKRQWPWHTQIFLSLPRKLGAQHQFQTKAIFHPGINHHFRVFITHLHLEKPGIADWSWDFGKVLNFHGSRVLFENLVKTTDMLATYLKRMWTLWFAYIFRRFLDPPRAYSTPFLENSAVAQWHACVHTHMCICVHALKGFVLLSTKRK